MLVAALGHIVRMIGDGDTGKAGHAARCLRKRDASIECTVTVIPHRNSPVIPGVGDKHRRGAVDGPGLAPALRIEGVAHRVAGAGRGGQPWRSIATGVVSG